MKASHTFNLLDARHAIGVTERQRYILRVRTLASRRGSLRCRAVHSDSAADPDLAAAAPTAGSEAGR